MKMKLIILTLIMAICFASYSHANVKRISPIQGRTAVLKANKKFDVIVSRCWQSTDKTHVTCRVSGELTAYINGKPVNKYWNIWHEQARWIGNRIKVSQV